MFKIGDTIPTVTLKQFEKNFDTYWKDITDNGRTYHLKTREGTVAIAPFRDESKWKKLVLELPDSLWALVESESARRSISVNLLVTLIAQDYLVQRNKVKKTKNPKKKGLKKK